MADKFPLTKQEFDAIYSKVPRLTVEVVLRGPDGVFLTKRNIEPCKGQWHLPGGTVYFGESLLIAVKRVARREIGIDVTRAEFLDYVEYPSHYLNGLDSPVGLAFKVTDYSGNAAFNGEANEAGWFTELPDNTHAEQDIFLVKHNLVKQ